MRKIALYGKGGIGKSTIAANLSASLAMQGLQVLQIGCDPKHDSTRLLVHGRPVVTILDYMREVPPLKQRLSDLLHTGFSGVVCAEAGGPEPGVGCAGRGILSAFALFERLGLRTDEFDIILYDVLGDVVCGGFAVPLRKGFADEVYVVTSEEFMSIYAANNILKGVANFDQDGFRLAGIILNSRGKEEDAAPVYRFAQAVGLPIVCHVPRSDYFRRAEEGNHTVIEDFPQSPPGKLLSALAHQVNNSNQLHPARPLGTAHLEEVVYAKTEPRKDTEKIAAPPSMSAQTEPAPVDLALSIPSSHAAREQNDPATLSKSMLFREPLHGCAFTGAICTTTQIHGAITVAHAPRSCSHIAHRTIVTSGIRTRLQTGSILPRQLNPLIVSSDMNERGVIYGGENDLYNTLYAAMKQKPEAVFVVTSCPSGVIGDDPDTVIKKIRSSFPAIPVCAITTDGNIRGDYMQGVINACLEGAAGLIDRTQESRDDQVNILAEKNIANNAEANFQVVIQLLNKMGVGVNCRFVRNTTVKALENFNRARLNLLAYEDHFGRLLRSYFSTHFQATFASYPFPVGMHATRQWLLDIGSFFDKSHIAKATADEYQQRYQKAIARIRPSLAGKKIMIVSYIHDVDWILETAFDLDMEVQKVGILHYSQDHLFRTRYTNRFALELDYTPEKRDADLLRFCPDLLLCNYVPRDLPLPLHVDGIPLCPDVGFYGGLALANRWTALLKAPLVEGWRQDGIHNA